MGLGALARQEPQGEVEPCLTEPSRSVSGGRTALGLGIDVRGPGLHSGGYLIGPGSAVNGMPYAITRDVPILELPGWIAERFTVLPA